MVGLIGNGFRVTFFKSKTSAHFKRSPSTGFVSFACSNSDSVKFGPKSGKFQGL
jgi:hypothetical protein